MHTVICIYRNLILVSLYVRPSKIVREIYLDVRYQTFGICSQHTYLVESDNTLCQLFQTCHKEFLFG
jgi:hypothetical protein